MFNIVKGTHDVIQAEAQRYSYIEEVMTNVALNYGYKEFRTPVLENSDLFIRSVGDSSDIVRKEMYTFEDKGGRSITLRPERTAGIIRSMVNAKLFANQDYPVKAFYVGPNFRYERPQQGRYRQFNQFGVECAGASTIERDVETIALGYTMLKVLGFDNLKLKINTLGDKESRENYKAALKEYFSKHIEGMCGDCKERFKLNILRILDCKVPEDRPIIDKAPKIGDYLTEEARNRFEKVKSYLTALEIPFEVDSELVRGLDYYSGIVFEFHYTASNGNNYGAIGAGGHYGNLISEIGGPQIEGVGFAFGIERIAKVMEDDSLFPELANGVDLFIMPMGEKAVEFSFGLAYVLRNLGYSTEVCYEAKSMGAMFKKAERREATLALIIGEDELNNNMITIKNLGTKEQTQINLQDLQSYLDNFFDIELESADDSECCCHHEGHEHGECCRHEGHEHGECCQDDDEHEHHCCHGHGHCHHEE